MKKFLLTIIVIVFSLVSNAQTSYGLKAGANFSKISVSGNAQNFSSDFITGFHVTGYANINLGTNLIFQPGISLQNKGGKLSFNSNSNPVDHFVKNIDNQGKYEFFKLAKHEFRHELKSSLILDNELTINKELAKVTIDEILENGGTNFTQHLMYVEMPLNVLYNIVKSSNVVFVGGGPYVAYGISTKTKSESISDSGSFKNADLNAFDLGFNFLGGYKLANGFLINAGYGLGLTNIAKDSGDDGSWKNQVISVGLGFQF